MAADDGSRRPSQPSTPVNPAGVGASASNRGSPYGMVSPDTIREILNTGDAALIDEAFEYWDPIDINRYLATIPTPPSANASPAGVGSAASNRSSPSPAVPQTPTGRVAAAAAAAGAGGGGDSGGSSSSSSSRSRRSSPPSGRVSGRSCTSPVPAPAPVPAPVGTSTPRGRPRQGQKEPRGRGRGRGGGGRGRGRPPRPNPSPTLPWTPPSPSQQGSPQAPLNQADLQRRLRMLLQDQEQIAAGRRIANITTTNSIVTSYKEGGRPSVQSNSSRFSP